jgi:hypothetical protein
MIILVCGGRDFTDYQMVCDTLSNIPDITRVVHGDARGADTLAGMWARANKITEAPYPANWTLHGKSAGPKRNQQMLDSEPVDMVVSFPGGRGTADMVRRATQKGIPVIVAETVV